MKLKRLAALDQATSCPASLLPPELWIYILRFFKRRETRHSRCQLYHVALVSSFFYDITVPLLYSHLILFTYSRSAILSSRHSVPSFPNPTATPAIVAIRAIANRSSLQPAVKSIQLVGHIDTVVLSRRMSARTSDIIEADELRNTLVSTLPLLTSLRSVALNAISLTSELSAALFHLPQLIKLVLVDCRAPIPPISIFRERPNENKLVHVELSFGSWTDTQTELEFISAFLYGPNLRTLVTDQSQVLTSLLHHQIRSKLSHLGLHRFGEKDAGLVAEFLGSQRCSDLKILDLEDCEFPQWVESSTVFPVFNLLQTFIGPPQIAHLFLSSESNVEEVTFRSSNIGESEVGPDLTHLAWVGGVRSLEIQLPRKQFIDGAVWAMFRDSFRALRVLRIHHNVAVESLQVCIPSNPPWSIQP